MATDLSNVIDYLSSELGDTNQIVIEHVFNDKDEIKIYPFVDLHFGDVNTDVAQCERFINQVKKDPNVYLMYLGDNMNNAVKTSVSNVYNETRSPHEQKKYLIELLKPVADRFLCFVPGNHEGRTSKDSDVSLVEDIADRLECSKLYRENIAFMDVKVGYNSHLKQQNSYRIAGLHGSGGGKHVGSMINNLENFGYAISGLDIIVCGHTHKKAASRPGRICFPTTNSKKMVQNDFLTCIAPPWQYWGGYASRGMFRPSTKGYTPIILNGKHKEFNTIV